LVLFQGFFAVSIISGNKGYYEFDPQFHQDLDQQGKHLLVDHIFYLFEGLYYPVVVRVGYHVIPFFAISMFSFV
jgi:hypothetical protein